MVAANSPRTNAGTRAAKPSWNLNSSQAQPDQPGSDCWVIEGAG
jgi:hypothetical protein